MRLRSESSNSRLSRDQIPTKALVDLVLSFKHLEFRTTFQETTDASVTTRYFQTPSPGTISERGNVEIACASSWVSCEPRKRRKERVLNTRWEGVGFPLGGFSEIELLLPPGQGSTCHGRSAGLAPHGGGPGSPGRTTDLFLRAPVVRARQSSPEATNPRKRREGNHPSSARRSSTFGEAGLSLRGPGCSLGDPRMYSCTIHGFNV